MRAARRASSSIRLGRQDTHTRRLANYGAGSPGSRRFSADLQGFGGSWFLRSSSLHAVKGGQKFLAYLSLRGHLNSQLPTPNSQPFPTPNSQELPTRQPGSYWELAVGN